MTLPAICRARPVAINRRVWGARAINVGVQLGARQNFDFEPLREALALDLAKRDVRTVEIQNPLAPAEAPLWEPRSIYPVAKYAEAFDLLITTAGYNGFHESVLGPIPTLFVPNEADEMDHQLLRARYAEVAGVAAMMRTSEVARVSSVLDECLRPEFRRTVITPREPVESGGRAAAVAIAELLASIRTDRPLALALPKCSV